MKLFIIVFSMVKPYEVNVASYVEVTMKDRLKHYSADGFPVVKETGRCWFLEKHPDGLPKQYRKSDEYKVIGNGKSIYMFGRDSKHWFENGTAPPQPR
ncbi:MAG: hypothetical protein IKO68_03595 [Oscillospiraceae bacterium]|nr:hypothetical protein [Oscillospiraceae bacterium]